MTPRRIPPSTVQFHIGDAVAKLIDLNGLNQTTIADRIDVRPNTVSDFVNQQAETKPETVEKILEVLQVTREEVDQLVARMNGKLPANSARRPNERADDRDPQLRDAREFGIRITNLPDVAQHLIFHVVRVLESAYRDSQRR